MTTPDLGSTVPRRQLGRYLRKLREDGQITIKAAAHALEWSPQKIWRIENGAVAMRSHDVETMCRGVRRGTAHHRRADRTREGDEGPRLVALVRRRGTGLVPALRRHGKCREPDTPVPVRGGAGSAADQGLRHRGERLASPGSLRVGARAVAGGADGAAAPAHSPAAEPPRLEVILSEHALRQPIPDREAMIGQLNHLVDVGEWPHVSIRVLPFSAGMHRAAVVGRFVVFDFPADGRREPEPSIVYCESLTGALYLDKEHEAETFKAVWKSIDRLALDEAESMVMIRAAAEEYTHDQLRADRVAQEHPQRRGR